MAAAGLALIAVALALASLQPQPPAKAGAREAAHPVVEGRVLVYVNGELKASAPMRSFLKPATPMLALGFFPTSGFQSAYVNFYAEKPSAWPSWHSYPEPYTDMLYYGGYRSDESVWGINAPIAPLVYVLDSGGSKWAEITLSTTPSVAYNATGVLVAVSGSVTPSISDAKTVATLRFIRPTGQFGDGAVHPVRLAEDAISPPVTVNPGDSLTVVYQFYFKSDQIFTENWGKAFFAWLYNVPGAKVAVTDTTGATAYIDPYASAYNVPANNAPVKCYIVLGNGSATFSRTAYKVVSEVARAEPSVQVYGGGVALSYSFTFQQDTQITELAVYVKLRNGKEVMVFYYVLPLPTTALANTPFAVTFRLNLPWQDRI